MAGKTKAEQKAYEQQLDRIIARCAWLAIFLALCGIGIYVINSHDTVNAILLAIFFPVIFAVIAFIFSPGEKKILMHLIEQWRLAAGLACVGIVLFGGFFLFKSFASATPPPPKKVIKIGVDLPLKGLDQADGQAILNAITIALKDAPMIDGYAIEVSSLNNANSATGLSDPDVGEANIKKLIEDPQVVAVIGPYNSGIAVKQIPLVNGAFDHKEIALLSPSTTADCLTTSLNSSADCNDVNKGGNFFRIAAYNDKSAQIFANCLSAPSAGPGDLCPNPDLHKFKSAIVIDDNTTYSTGYAASFKTYWLQKPDTKAVAQKVSNKASKNSFIDALAAAHKELGSLPDLVFFAGSSDNAKILHTVIQQSKFTASSLPDFSAVAMATGAGSMNDDFVDHLKRSSPLSAPVYTEAPLATLSTVDSGKQKNAHDFISTYEQNYKEKPTPYSAAGYDATKIILQAIAAAAGKGGIPDQNDPIAVQNFRSKIIDSIRNPVDTGVAGLTGRYTFDENGDFKDSAISVFKWNELKQSWEYQ